MRVVVLNHITLDGVLQGPGRSEEDTRGGFRHGGWAIPGGDEVMIHPVVLGAGQRLFDGTGPPVRLRLVESEPTTTGVIIATYQPAEQTNG